MSSKFLASMIPDALNVRCYCNPCCSTCVVIPDTMCDTTFQIDHGFPNVAPESYEFPRHADVEMDLLMRTLHENPDFFDPAAFPALPLPMTTLQGGYEEDFGASEQPQMFATDFYEPNPTTQTPVASPDPSLPAQGPAQFEEFSLATQLPGLNDYSGTFAIPDTAPTMVNSTKFQPYEPYSAQYFFTTPPDTPPNMFPPVPSVSMQSAPCGRQPTSSNADPTPTIRKLLQQKKKRITAVPCHINSVCTTCQTRTTSLWRRNHLGEIECNACNLYFRKNNCKRPMTLRKDEIMKRKRKPRLEPSQSTADTAAITNTPVEVKSELFA
ncbi:GATA zinc finger [Teladorsagia circumcincta]|uniref:GATA zinc finger n=1 Tax=Teladorsagia circumcincta TaxID=45464 RepID=A0A2G9UWX9_TELCI|nr:GATA zinc finger [Teladorsagia circumcincta]